MSITINIFQEVETSKDFDIQCQTCGNDLTATQFRDTIHVEPCEECFSEKYNEGFQAGMTDGYQDGLSDGRAGIDKNLEYPETS